MKTSARWTVITTVDQKTTLFNYVNEFLLIIINRPELTNTPFPLSSILLPKNIRKVL